MDGQVGVTADGAGEVGVVLQHQTIVALGLLFVESLGHAAEHTGVDDLLIGGAAHTLEDGAQLLGSGNVLGEVVIDAAGLQQGVQTLQLLGVGLFMDAVDEGQLLPVKMLCHCLIRCEHEILDQHSRYIPLVRLNIQWMSFLI